jgi:hypothetical protein
VSPPGAAGDPLDSEAAGDVVSALGRAGERGVRFPVQWRRSLRSLQSRSGEDGTITAQELTAGVYWLIERLDWIESRDRALAASCRDAERELRALVSLVQGSAV